MSKSCTTTILVPRSLQCIKKYAKYRQPPSLASFLVFLQGVALRRIDGSLHRALQADGTFQCRSGFLHLVVLSAMGSEAILAPLCQSHSNSTMVDSPHRNHHRRFHGQHSLHPTLAIQSSGVVGFILGGFILVCLP